MQEVHVYPGDSVALGEQRFVVKDSGQRQEFDSGMVRDVTEGKTLWHLCASGPMLRRWANHMTAGAEKYGPDNWMLASGEAEKERFRQSAFRHFMQWYFGDRDEDHGAAVFFNINGAEYVEDRMLETFDPRPAEATEVSDTVRAVLVQRYGPGPWR